MSGAASSRVRRSGSGQAEGGLAPSILIVEDEPTYAKVLSRLLEVSDIGGRNTSVSSLAEARRMIEAQDLDLVILDVHLPDGNGLDLLSEIRSSGPSDLPVLILTAFGSVEDAVQAMKLGATDYLAKADDPAETIMVVRKALRTGEAARRLAYARQRDHHAFEGVRMVGQSAAMQTTRRELRRIARLRADEKSPGPTVLIQGPTGTGKDLAARLIHLWGPTPGHPFVQVDCASLPRDLIEAELFGHERGAFTQAVAGRVGLIEAAERGTLFLDEIGELPPGTQAKLLGAIDRRRVRRIGSNRERPVSARIVAATNRDLKQMVASGGFREDLYFRLNVLAVKLPPLEEREGDVPLLVQHFASRAARQYALPEPEFSAEALAALAAYEWPGNVRELRNIVERAVMLQGSEPVPAEVLGLSHGEARADRAADLVSGRLTLDEAERLLIQDALQRSRMNVSAAARRLGITRATLRSRLKKHGIDSGVA